MTKKQCCSTVSLNMRGFTETPDLSRILQADFYSINGQNETATHSAGKSHFSEDLARCQLPLVYVNNLELYKYRGQKTTFRSWFLSSIMWVKLRPMGLMAGTLTC